jgi:hypothetical protein
LCDAFYFGLKDKIKDLLTEAGRPSTLAKLKADALKFDHRVMERQRERPASRAMSPPAPRSAAMDVDTLSTRPPKKSPRGPLSVEEKERRKRDRLCGYCVSATCPGGVTANSALCPFVIAKEEAKKQGKAHL